MANLSSSIASLQRRRDERPIFDELLALSNLLFARADVLGSVADYHQAELVGGEASARAPDAGTALYIRACLAERDHRFAEATALLDQALASGHPTREIDVERATILQAMDRYDEALVLCVRVARENPTIQTLCSLASLLAEMGHWVAAEKCYTAALEADDGVSPFPCGELLFEWGVCAMRRGDPKRAEEILSDLIALLSEHAPGRALLAEIRAAQVGAA